MRLNFKALIYLLIAIPFLIGLAPAPESNNYVVVAAYGKSWESLAKSFAEEVASDYPEVEYDFFPEKNMYMVFVDKNLAKDKAISKMRQLRQNPKYDRTWVYVYKGGTEEELADSQEEMIEETQVTAEPEPVAEPEPEPEPEPAPEPEIVEEEKPEPVVYKYKIYFNVYESVNSDPLNSDLEIIDPARAKMIQTVKGNELFLTNGPDNNSQDIQVVADVLGYRKLIHTFNLIEPLVDSTAYFVEEKGDSLVIDMPLVKFRKGDLFTLFHVYFFSHSAVMKPESKYELDQLVGLMEGNPKLKIKLHGHTNGGASDKSRHKEGENAPFFNLDDTVEQTTSAKRLSEMRAEEVARYLRYSGIAGDRMEIIGWGGKKMLYKKLDTKADRNVRVEVEILEE